MRQGPRAFYSVSTEYSDIPIFCEIKDKLAFKSLQGTTAFFWVRASRCMLHLRPQHQGITHIIIAERSLLLRCLWKVGIPLVSKPDNQLSFLEVLGYTELSSSCCTEFCVPLDLGRCSWGISGVSQRMSNHLSCLMVNAGWLLRQCRQIWPHLGLIWGTQNSFVLPQWPQGPSKHVTVFLGTVWSSIKEVKAPFRFDGYHGISVHALLLNRASSRGKWKVSYFLASCIENLGYILTWYQGWPYNSRVCAEPSHSCLVERDISGFSSRHGSALWMPIERRWKPRFTFRFHQVYWDSYQYSRGVRHHLILKL